MEMMHLTERVSSKGPTWRRKNLDVVRKDITIRETTESLIGQWVVQGHGQKKNVRCPSAKHRWSTGAIPLTLRPCDEGIAIKSDGNAIGSSERLQEVRHQMGHFTFLRGYDLI